ncbi:Choline transporter-like protein [Lasiodiplodia theobromae]|nr:Choline transporter-like protein [Lasiodiplodia theobromae]
MFSEYASRFLAQSQSRLLGGQENGEPSQHSSRPSRHRGPNQASSRYQPSRSYLQRPNMPNPYGPSASQVSRFPFASRTSGPAPLFYSATDDFREEDDGEEHEREVADFYALQKSRRQFGGSHLTDSSDMDDHERASKSEHSNGGEDDDEGAPFARGIRSSWRGSRATVRGREPTVQPIQEDEGRERSVSVSEASAPSSKGKGKLVDVELASTAKDSGDEFQDDYSDDDQDAPPAYQHLPRAQGINPPRNPLRNTLPIPLETDEEALLQHPRPASPDRETVVTIVPEEQEERYDSFWSYLYLICLAAFLGTAFLVWLHTSAPGKKLPLGDTIYSTLHSSFHLLSVYTLISMIVAGLWLACLSYFAQPLVQLITLGVPIILTSFFLYPFISSFKGSETTFQDKAMRWTSFIPGICAVLWIHMVYQGRRSIDKATRILQLASRVLAECSALVLVGLAVLAFTVLWTWTWIGLFTRLFLEGHRSDGKITLWVIDFSTWWLGAFYILFFLWTSSIIAGIQRSLTAATVSQWYFHRYATPKPTSRQVAQASFWHAVGPMFGSVCLSTFLTIALRLPLMVLPRRFAAFVSLCLYQFIPTSAVMLTNPLTLTYASIHSMDLRRAAHGLRQLSFVSHSRPTTTLTPRSFSSPSGHELVPYRLAKLLLHATRFVMCMALGFGGWAGTAHSLELAGAKHHGSYYAYVVGMIAAAIGWSVLGAFEGVLGFILDGLIVCWGSEVGSQGTGQSRYCPDAGQLFGEESRRY